MSNRMNQQINTMVQGLQILNNDGSVSTQSQDFNLALFQYLTYTNSINQQNITAFNQSNNGIVQQQIYFILTNGYAPPHDTHINFDYRLGVLRNASESIALQFFNNYQSYSDHYVQMFNVILALAIVVTVLAIGVIVPIVYKINIQNNQIMSLFG